MTWWSFVLCPASVQRRWRERREEYSVMAWESGVRQLWRVEGSGRAALASAERESAVAAASWAI